MHLELGREVLPVNQLGPDFVWVESAQALPAGTGRLVVSVDEETTTRQVLLPDGVTAGLTRATIRNADATMSDSNGLRTER